MKEININIIEPLIRSGIVRISPFKNALLCATFFGMADGSRSVNSDRGVEHLFACLYEKIVGNAVMDGESSVTERANKKYPYPLSLGHSSDIIKMLEKSYTELSYCLEEPDENKKFKVYAEQIEIPSLSSVAGRYAKMGEGITLEEAFAAAVLAEPVLL